MTVEQRVEQAMRKEERKIKNTFIKASPEQATLGGILGGIIALCQEIERLDAELDKAKADAKSDASWSRNLIQNP